MTTLHGQLMEEKLRDASCLGDIETAIKLLRVGVDINSRNTINGWTALHWACKRSHIPIVTLLLKNGADKTIQNTAGETPADLASNSQIKSLLENGIPESLQHDFVDVVRITQSDKQPYSTVDPTNHNHYKSFDDVIVLKVRIANSPDPDFIEIEMPPEKVTYKGLVGICSEELGLLPEQIVKVRKLPDTRLRNDKDIRRLKQWQELELIVQDGVAGSTNIYQPITNKTQTVLY